ncbi:hypothetical protein BVRB_6g149460 [Beta vulgaris subsp. vulgaris]|nr:hypothetical protein BVRB_6g149460 [Beta vulgaris subsp. vulgaris]
MQKHLLACHIVLFSLCRTCCQLGHAFETVSKSI